MNDESKNVGPLTTDEIAAGCVATDVMPNGATLATGTSSKVHDPDRWLAQDLENQFRTIFFQHGDYSKHGLVIRGVEVIGQIEGDQAETGMVRFTVWHSGDSKVVFNYSDYKDAYEDRVKLMLMVDAFHSTGLFKGD